MLRATQHQLVAALERVGISRGEGLLVHSALQFLGQPEGGVELYLHALSAVLDGPDAVPDRLESGTLAVPAFNFAFARGEPYDPKVTPTLGMGAFSETVRLMPEARRTPHPMQSLATVGRWADDLAGRDTPSAFDSGSAFERMLELDFKLLLLGADIQAVSMLHYCEQRRQVPYRFWKEFRGLVRTSAGWEQRAYRLYARDLELDPQIELYPVQDRLESRGQWRAMELNYGKISVCRLADFVTAVDEFLRTDPWSLVVNRKE
jgi:aminoglycoside N3'-acetyltransferase